MKIIKENELPMNSSLVHGQSSHTGETIAHENVVTLYRYAGAALHSMIQKRTKLPNNLEDDQELKYLYTIKIRKDEYDHLNKQVQSLNFGGLFIISPVMIPFLRALMDDVNK